MAALRSVRGRTVRPIRVGLTHSAATTSFRCASPKRSELEPRSLMAVTRLPGRAASRTMVGCCVVSPVESVVAVLGAKSPIGVASHEGREDKQVDRRGSTGSRGRDLRFGWRPRASFARSGACWSPRWTSAREGSRRALRLTRWAGRCRHGGSSYGSRDQRGQGARRGKSGRPRRPRPSASHARRTQSLRGRSPRRLVALGEAGRPGDARRSGVAAALELQEHADALAGDVRPARRSCERGRFVAKLPNRLCTGGLGKARALFSLASSFRVLRSDVDFMEVSLLDAGWARRPVATMDVRPTAARDERATSRLTLRAHRAASSLAPVEFLARLAAIVPPPRYPLLRYAGVLGPRSSCGEPLLPRGGRAAGPAALRGRARTGSRRG